MFLAQEDLVRARMRDVMKAADEQRRISHYQAARRWQRVADWAARRACRSFALL
jgi:hypothetical protein